jgi:hypothetical protein
MLQDATRTLPQVNVAKALLSSPELALSQILQPSFVYRVFVAT